MISSNISLLYSRQLGERTRGVDKANSISSEVICRGGLSELSGALYGTKSKTLKVELILHVEGRSTTSTFSPTYLRSENGLIL